MKKSTQLALTASAALGLAAVSMPVFAQQGQMQHGAMMGGAKTYAMATFDTNKDGTLSPAEMAAGIRAELKTYDADGNGTLSLKEFAVMHAVHTRPMTVRAFQMHDADGDAQLTEAEMVTMATMMQSPRGRMQGMMGSN